jgi:hypothetical protein
MKLTLALIRSEVKTYTSPASYIIMEWYIYIYQAILMTRVRKQILLSLCVTVISVVYFLLGDSSVSEFYVPTFRNILSNLHRSYEREE